MTSEGDLIAVAQAMTASMDGLARQVGGLNTQVDAQESYGRRNRRMIWGLVISIALDAALTVALVGVAVATNDAANKATQVHNQQVTTCLSSNEARAKNVQLWDHVLSIPPTVPRSAAQAKQAEDFKIYVHQVFAPRDCSKI